MKKNILLALAATALLATTSQAAEQGTFGACNKEGWVKPSNCKTFDTEAELAASMGYIVRPDGKWEQPTPADAGKVIVVSSRVAK